MIKKIWSSLMAVMVAGAAMAATSEVDLCYIIDAGTCDHCISTVVVARDAGVTWSSAETGAVTCEGSNAVLDIAVSITLTDWIANSINSDTYDYIVDDINTPTKVVRQGTLAMMLAENDFSDLKGVYAWTENGTVPFDAVTVKEGSYAFGPILEGGGDYIYSSSAITETIYVVEVWFNRGAIAWNGNFKRIWESGSNNLLAAWSQLSFNNGAPGWWTGINESTWYHLELEMGGVGYGTKLLVDGTERLTSAATTQPTNQVSYVGAKSDGTLECNCWIDSIRFRSSLGTSYPTIGDY